MFILINILNTDLLKEAYMKLIFFLQTRNDIFAKFQFISTHNININSGIEIVVSM